MKIRKTTPSGLVLEFDGDDCKELIREMSAALDIFGEPCCGMCKSPNISPVYRKAKGYEYYELACKDCNARLRFGQTKEDQVLFPKRKLEDGSWDRQHRGWSKYSPQEQPRQQALPNEEDVPF